MSATDLGLILAVFLACLVEAVEALTIVLAIGTTRGWPSALAGTGAAAAVLAASILALGPALTSVPIQTLRLLVGGLLLIFGLSWLAKAVLRRAGLKATHDEAAIFAAQSAAARAAGDAPRRLDGYAFAISFKGVLLEGLEVVLIVLTIGSAQHRLGLAVLAAALAVVLVTALGAAARAPLTRVPENTMKLTVGVLLTSFGTFWGAQGAGASWPGGDAALALIVPVILLTALQTASVLARRQATGAAVQSGKGERDPRSSLRPLAPLLSVWQFVAGEDWRVPVVVIAALALTALLAGASLAAWWVLPLAVLALLWAPLIQVR